MCVCVYICACMYVFKQYKLYVLTFNRNNIYENNEKMSIIFFSDTELPNECQFADCSFLHSNTCREHRLITACCCNQFLAHKK